MNNDPPPWLAHARSMMGLTPFIASLNGEVLDMGKDGAHIRVPYGAHLVGDPDSGIVHGGVITGLLDHASGMAVMSSLREPMPIATLDLRIDYMKPAVPGEAIIAVSRCLKVTHDIAFVRGAAHQGDEANPIALCTGTFMLIRGQKLPYMAKA